MKISEMISESIVNLPEAVFAGSVINCIVDKKLKKVTHYILLNQEDEEVFLPIKKLKKGVDTYLVLSGDAVCNSAPSGVWCPLNMPVFDTDGKKVGRLKDFEFDESGKITGVSPGNTDIVCRYPTGERVTWNVKVQYSPVQLFFIIFFNVFISYLSFCIFFNCMGYITNSITSFSHF